MILEIIGVVILGTMIKKAIDMTVNSRIGRPCARIRFLSIALVGERLGRGRSLVGSTVAEL